MSELRRRQVYAQDKLLGVAEMAKALHEGRPQLLPPDFLLHLNELTLLVQRAGPQGITTVPLTSFKPLAVHADVGAEQRDHLKSYKPKWPERMLSKIVDALHRS